MGALARAFARAYETRATTFQQVWGADAEWLGRTTWAGKPVTRESMLGLSAVFACVRFITDAVSTLPFHAFGSAGRRDPQPMWLQRPIPQDPSTTLVVHLQQVLSSLLIDGNAYVLVTPHIYDPQQVHVLDPWQVEPRRLPDGSMRWRVGGRDEWDWANIIHIPLIRLPGEVKGLSPLEAERQTFAAAAAAEEFGARFFGQGASLSGVIELPPGLDLNEDQAKELVDKFQLRYGGASNAHRPGVLTGGATWKALSITPEQAQFLETRQYDDERIFRIYRVPPALAGMVREGATSNASSISQALAFEKHTVRPIATLIEDAYRPLAGPSPADYFKFETKGLLRGDPKTQAELYQVQLQTRQRTVNEVRALEDVAPFAGAAGGLLDTPTNVAADPRFEAAGALIRAGFRPEAALAALGLPPIEHTGTLPVTVQA